MEMSYGGTLVMPKSYAVMDQEEMCYVEGGATSKIYGKAKTIRTRINVILACQTGIALASVLAGGIVGGLAGLPIFGSWLACASTAHAQVEDIIDKYGKNRRCLMKTTYTLGGLLCTSMTVTRA